MTTSVDTPSPEQERPRIAITLAIAATCFGLGIGSVLMMSASPTQVQSDARASAVTAKPTSTPKPSRAAPPTEAAKSPQTAAAKTPNVLTEAPVASAPLPVTPTPVPASAPTPQSNPSEATSPESVELTMIQGRVAYLRCDGLSGDRGRFPCPRDAAFERSVWETLAALPQCKPSLGRGGADVRLDISRNQRPEVRVIAIPGSPEPTLDTQRVYACVGRSLAKLSTTLDPLYMMVSFRVALR